MLVGSVLARRKKVTPPIEIYNESFSTLDNRDERNTPPPLSLSLPVECIRVKRLAKRPRFIEHVKQRLFEFTLRKIRQLLAEPTTCITEKEQKRKKHKGCGVKNQVTQHIVAVMENPPVRISFYKVKIFVFTVF